jgi:hypothetical protein
MLKAFFKLFIMEGFQIEEDNALILHEREVLRETH